MAPAAPALSDGDQHPGRVRVGDARANSVKRVASAVGEGSICVQLVHRALAIRHARPRVRGAVRRSSQVRNWTLPGGAGGASFCQGHDETAGRHADRGRDPIVGHAAGLPARARREGPLLRRQHRPQRHEGRGQDHGEGGEGSRSRHRRCSGPGRPGSVRSDEQGRRGQRGRLDYHQRRSELASKGFDPLRVHVDTDSKVVTLSGTVESPAQREKAIALARAVKDVASVTDHLFIRR